MENINQQIKLPLWENTDGTPFDRQQALKEGFRAVVYFIISPDERFYIGRKTLLKKVPSQDFDNYTGSATDEKYQDDWKNQPENFQRIVISVHKTDDEVEKAEYEATVRKDLTGTMMWQRDDCVNRQQGGIGGGGSSEKPMVFGYKGVKYKVFSQYEWGSYAGLEGNCWRWLQGKSDSYKEYGLDYFRYYDVSLDADAEDPWKNEKMREKIVKIINETDTRKTEVIVFFKNGSHKIFETMDECRKKFQVANRTIKTWIMKENRPDAKHNIIAIAYHNDWKLSFETHNISNEKRIAMFAVKKEYNPQKKRKPWTLAQRQNLSEVKKGKTPEHSCKSITFVMLNGEKHKFKKFIDAADEMDFSLDQMTAWTKKKRQPNVTEGIKKIILTNEVIVFTYEVILVEFNNKKPKTFNNKTDAGNYFGVSATSIGRWLDGSRKTPYDKYDVKTIKMITI